MSSQTDLGYPQAKPKNLPHNWDYQARTDTVICGGCMFRFGAEHPDGDGKGWTCPNCGDGNGTDAKQSVLHAEEH